MAASVSESEAVEARKGRRAASDSTAVGDWLEGAELSSKVHEIFARATGEVAIDIGPPGLSGPRAPLLCLGDVLRMGDVLARGEPGASIGDNRRTGDSCPLDCFLGPDDVASEDKPIRGRIGTGGRHTGSIEIGVAVPRSAAESDGADGP
jgi:hypothetical protein